MRIWICQMKILVYEIDISCDLALILLFMVREIERCYLRYLGRIINAFIIFVIVWRIAPLGFKIFTMN